MEPDDSKVWARINAVKHWYHRIVIRPGIVTPGTNEAGATLSYLDLPLDLRGKRVLDVGTRDGYFAFEAERRGAEVVAVDYVSKDETGFGAAAELLGSKVTFYQANIFDLKAETLGTFDVILFLGLLYHLPDPMLAIQILRSLARDRLCLETHAIDNAVLLADGVTRALKDVAPLLVDIPIMQFYPGRALQNDPTNYWGPNLRCLLSMVEESNWVVLSHHVVGSRAIMNCRILENPELAYQARIARGLVPSK